MDLFCLCLHNVITMHVALPNNSICKNLESAPRGANNRHPLSWGQANGKDPYEFTLML